MDAVANGCGDCIWRDQCEYDTDGMCDHYAQLDDSFEEERQYSEILRENIAEYNKIILEYSDRDGDSL